MIQRSTFSDLLSYAYNETDLCSADRIQRAIDGDPNLQAQYNSLNETLKMLDCVVPDINPALIKRILEFA